MSKLSAQCDELRAMAVSVGLAMPQAATLMMGAADVIERLDTKNAKLRELVKDLHTLAGDVLPERKTDYLTIRSVEWCIDYYSREMPAIEQRMSELGIEVEQ